VFDPEPECDNVARGIDTAMDNYGSTDRVGV
jgi:hypothetical protein